MIGNITGRISGIAQTVRKNNFITLSQNTCGQTYLKAFKMLTNKELRDNVFANFKTVRLKLKFNQTEMAKSLRMPQKSYGAIEERRAVSVESVYKLSVLTGITMDEIFTTKLT